MRNLIDNDNLNISSKEELQTSEIRYRRLFEAARDGILILDAVSRKITDVNPFMMELLGYTQEEFLGKELWEIGLLKDEEASIAAFKELQDKKFIRYKDLPLETKAGEKREVEFVSNVYSEDGRQVVQCNIRDITERMNFERNAYNLAAIVESSNDAIISKDFDGTILSWNKGAEKVFGYGEAEIIGQNILILFPPELLHEENQILETIKRGESIHDFETIRLRKDGSRVPISLSHSPIKNRKGEITAVSKIARDITNRKQLEAQLRQSQKLEAVGLLAGGIAHDFNNMLTAINGYSDLTLRQLKEDDPLRDNIEQIKKAGQRSADLTQQLLAFSRQQVLHPVVSKLNEIIADTITMLQRVIGEDIQLTTTLNPKIGQALIDPGQFSQIIMNLAINARDAMPQGGRLTIETTNIFLDPIYTSQHVGFLPGAYVMLSVSDNGTGMNKETKQHLFEPFFTTKEVGKGTGLGLATVYGIVKQSGGNIEVYSEEGFGTTFKIYLPRVAELAEATSTKVMSSEMPTGTETILLVEDEELVRNLSREILETCGYTVIEAQNGLEALKICDKGDYKFDLLMTDVVMPEMGGRVLAEKLIEQFPNLKILFTSGYTDDAVVRHGVIETNTNFIQKPFTLDALANKIRRILDD